MITYATTYDSGLTHVVAVARDLMHPLADEISLSIGDSAYANFPYSAEVAFFKDGAWVTTILEEFAAWADAKAGDTLVYGYVPMHVVGEFLKNWRKM